MSRIREALLRHGRERAADAGEVERSPNRDAFAQVPWNVSRSAGDIGPASSRRVGVPLTGDTRVQPAPVEAPSRPIAEAIRTGIDGRAVVTPGAPLVFVQQYRRLAGSLWRMRDRGVKTLMVTSTAAGEGKTLTAANLALTLSESYRARVLLVDGDLWRPGLGRIFDLPAAAGLRDLLSSAGEIGPMVPLSARLSVLPAGQPAPDLAMGLLNSPRMRRVLGEVRDGFDWVIVDTAPVCTMPDAGPLADMFDGTLVVVAAGQTPAADLDLAVQALGRDHIVGAVLNRATRVGQTARAYSYGYGYDYAE